MTRLGFLKMNNEYLGEITLGVPGLVHGDADQVPA